MKKEGFLHALVSVFNQVDIEGDLILKGAFERSLDEWCRRGKWPVGIFSHDLKRPIARTLSIWEENDGLHILAEFNLDTQRSLEVYSDLCKEVLSEYSIGFQVKKSKKIGKIRQIYDVNLIEWSPVVFGAHPGTRTLAIGSYKEALNSIRKNIATRFLRNEFEILV